MKARLMIPYSAGVLGTRICTVYEPSPQAVATNHRSPSRDHDLDTFSRQPLRRDLHAALQNTWGSRPTPDHGNEGMSTAPSNHLITALLDDQRATRSKRLCTTLNTVLCSKPSAARTPRWERPAVGTAVLPRLAQLGCAMPPHPEAWADFPGRSRERA